MDREKAGAAQIGAVSAFVTACLQRQHPHRAVFRFVWVACLLLQSLPQTTAAITLREAVHASLAVHPEVHSAMAEVDQASTELDISKGGYYPKLQASAGPDSSFFGDLGYDITVSQMLYDWGRVASRVDASSAQQRQKLENLLVVRDDAALDICEVYLDVLTAEQRVSSVRTHIQRLDDLNDLIRQRTSAGYSDSGELSRAALELSRAQEQLSIEKGTLRDARQQYQELTGEPAADLEQPDIKSFAKQLLGSGALEEAITASPLYRQTQQEKAVEEAKVREADAALRPQLNLEGSVMRREIGGDPTNDSALTLRVRMDTFEGLSNFQRPRAARQRLLAAEWNVDATRRDIRRKVMSLLESETTMRWREQSLSEQIKSAQDVASIYEEQFVVGLRDMTDLLNIQRERFEAERQLISLRSEHQRVQYRASAQLGLLVPLLEERLPTGGVR